MGRRDERRTVATESRKKKKKRKRACMDSNPRRRINSIAPTRLHVSRTLRERGTRICGRYSRYKSRRRRGRLYITCSAVRNGRRENAQAPKKKGRLIVRWYRTKTPSQAARCRKRGGEDSPTRITSSFRPKTFSERRSRRAQPMTRRGSFGVEEIPEETKRNPLRGGRRST